MLSEIQTFGESLSKWMEEQNLTPSALAAFMRETRDATIARLMHDQLDYQRCARFITELSESYPDIDDDTLKRLRICVDVNRYGKEMYLAQKNFFRMMAGNDKNRKAEYCRADEFCERLIAWSRGMHMKLLCMGLGDIGPQRFLTEISMKRKDIHVYDIFDCDHVGELSGLLAEALPVAFNPNYQLIEIRNNRGAMMNNVMIARREDGAHLLMVYDESGYKTIHIEKGTEILDFSLNVLLAEHHAPKKINHHFNYNGPDAYLTFLSHCLSLEKDKAIYQIKSEIGLEYIPIDILFDNFSEWAHVNDPRFIPFLDPLREIFENRYRNILTKSEPTYLIMTKNGMMDFAKTGRMKDHPFCLRSFTPEERKRIFRNLLDAASQSSSITPFFLMENDISLNYSFIGYSRECILVCAAQADYDLNNYTEIVLESGELAGQFADFVTMILSKNHVLSKKANLDFIQSLIDITE